MVEEQMQEEQQVQEEQQQWSSASGTLRWRLACVVISAVLRSAPGVPAHTGRLPLSGLSEGT
jgi:hypothetical protein